MILLCGSMLNGFKFLQLCSVEHKNHNMEFLKYNNESVGWDMPNHKMGKQISLFPHCPCRVVFPLYVSFQSSIFQHCAGMKNVHSGPSERSFLHAPSVRTADLFLAASKVFSHALLLGACLCPACLCVLPSRRFSRTTVLGEWAVFLFSQRFIVQWVSPLTKDTIYNSYALNWKYIVVILSGYRNSRAWAA